MLSMALVSSTSHAQGSRLYGLGVNVSTGYQTYSLADANSEILEGSPLLPGARVDVDGGLALAAGLRLAISEKIVVGIGIERLLASTDGEGSLSGQRYTYDLQLPANALTATGTFFPLKGARARAGIGGGLGYYRSDGEVKVENSGTEVKSQLRGDGFGAHALVTSEIGLGKRFCAEVSAGYRSARTSDVELKGPTGAKQYDSHIDWSGLSTNIGLTYYITE